MSIYHFLTGKSIIIIFELYTVYTTIVCFMFFLLEHDWMAARLVLYCPGATSVMSVSRVVARLAPPPRRIALCMASEQGLLQLSVTGRLAMRKACSVEHSRQITKTPGWCEILEAQLCTTHPAWTPAISPEILLDDHPTCLPWCHLHVLDMLGMNE